MEKQIRLAGWQDTQLRGVAAGAGPQQEHLMIRIGRALLILEDRAALDQLAMIVDNAVDMADRVSGPADDEYAAAKATAAALARQRGRRHPADVLYEELNENAKAHPPRRRKP